MLKTEFKLRTLVKIEETRSISSKRSWVIVSRIDYTFLKDRIDYT